MNVVKQLIRIAILAIVFLGINFVVQTYYRIEAYKGYLYTQRDLVPTSSVGLVFGAGVKPDGRLTDALTDRVLTGVELYKTGKVKKLLMSGDNGSKTYDEVTAMKKFAVEQGVPEVDVVLDYAGFDTYDTCYRAREIFDLHTGVVLVSQEFHLPRALYICNELGVKSVGLKADKRVYATNLWGVREFLARVKAGLNITFHSKPKFLGQKEKVF